jgi:hypothetical protein
MHPRSARVMAVSAPLSCWDNAATRPSGCPGGVGSSSRAWASASFRAGQQPFMLVRAAHRDRRQAQHRVRIREPTRDEAGDQRVGAQWQAWWGFQRQRGSGLARPASRSPGPRYVHSGHTERCAAPVLPSSGRGRAAQHPRRTRARMADRHPRRRWLRRSRRLAPAERALSGPRRPKPRGVARLVGPAPGCEAARAALTAS